MVTAPAVNLSEYYEHVLKSKRWSSRHFIKEAISAMEKEWNQKDIFIIEAPTGYGKSTISISVSLYSLNEELKSIIVFPLRTLLEDQHAKFSEVIRENLLGKRYMHHAESKYLVKPVTLTTIDTLSLTFFGIPPEELEKVVKFWNGTSSGSLGHYLFSHSSIILSNLILDEVHLLFDSTKSLNFLVLLIEYAVKSGQKLILMSATLPSAFIRFLESYRLSSISEYLNNKMRIISFCGELIDNEFVEKRKKKRYNITIEGLKEEEKFEEIIKKFYEFKGKGVKKTIIIFNEVEDAKELYKRLTEKSFTKDKMVLLHSRFNEDDRKKKELKLRELRMEDEYLIIATQTIEAGVDISSNLFITELAPANSLIQRLGRFLRYEDEKEGEVYIWYEADEKGELKKHSTTKYKVYDWKLTKRTLEWLEQRCEATYSNKRITWTASNSNINFHLPGSYKCLIDYVYTIDGFKVKRDEIENFLNIFDDIENLSIKALDKYIELEGSFIRDSLMVSVIPKSMLNVIRTENNVVKIEELNNKAIPVSLEQLKRFSVIGVIKLGVEKEGVKEVGVLSEVPKDLIHLLRSGKIQPLLRKMLKSRIITLVVDGEYNEEVGLVW